MTSTGAARPPAGGSDGRPRRGLVLTTLILGAAVAGLNLAVANIAGGSSRYGLVGTAYGLIGTGVGFAVAPASRSLMASVPRSRAERGSATNDLQRDLGGARGRIRPRGRGRRNTGDFSRRWLIRLSP